jgi:hypothetical protein
MRSAGAQNGWAQHRHEADHRGCVRNIEITVRNASDFYVKSGRVGPCRTSDLCPLYPQKSGHRLSVVECPLCAKSGLSTASNSITLSAGERTDSGIPERDRQARRPYRMSTRHDAPHLGQTLVLNAGSKLLGLGGVTVVDRRNHALP